MRRYAEYKDSGVPWIGEIPLDWRVGRPKYNYYLKGRIGWQGLKSDEFVDNTPYYLVTGTDFRNGRVDWSKCYHITKERFAEAPEIHVKSGDLLVTKDGTIGKVAYIEDKPDYVSLNSHLLLMRPLNNLFDNRFLFWVIQCQVFENYYGVTQSGSIMASLSQEKISNFSFPLPSKEEQAGIANYLENKIKIIDSMIDEAKVSIEEYKTWKASIIYEAVTKGLNRNAKMKDSGISHIGQVPIHWNIKRFKFVATVKSNLVDPSDYGKYPQIAPDSIEKGSGKILEYKTVEESGVISGNHLFYKGQILYSKIRPLLNKAAIAPFDGLCSADMYPIETKENTNFILYVILSDYFLQQVALYIADRVKMPKINQEELSCIIVAIPPLWEQNEITIYLDKKCSQIDSLIAEKESLIADLEAYKKSLIFETVTGKRKVV